jgi:hypothetical protein
MRLVTWLVTAINNRRYCDRATVSFTSNRQILLFCILFNYTSGSQSWMERPLGGGGITKVSIKRKGGGRGSLKMGTFECVVFIFTIEFSLDQILGNWFQFVNPHLSH